MSKSKTMGQVFTPVKVVQFMLDSIGYTVQSDILSKKIYEPSFGKGVFLFEIIDRLIGNATQAGVDTVAISHILNTNVHGVEFDGELYAETIATLTSHVQGKGIPAPTWDNLVCADSLTLDHGKVFDFVVGNPPYIRTHNLSDEMRMNIEKFSLTSIGTPDMYVTFMEYGLSVLKQGGKLSYIVPNSWLKNTSQKGFREHLFSSCLVESIYDFASEKVFASIGTYTAIVTLSDTNSVLRYSQKDESGEWETSTIPYSELVGDETWLFQSPKNQAFLRANRANETLLGEVCVVQNALMTMRNSIYLAAVKSGVEEELLYDAVKASTYRGGPVTEKILFPYKRSEGGITPYSEAEFSALYPKAYSFLIENKAELLARKRDSSAEWFHYGRSQGVAALPQRRKIVFRQHLSDSQETMDVHILPASTLVYGGWYIMEKEGSGYSLEDIKEIMESKEFCSVMRLTGKDMSGGYKELYSKHLKAFGITPITGL